MTFWKCFRIISQQGSELSSLRFRLIKKSSIFNKKQSHSCNLLCHKQAQLFFQHYYWVVKIPINAWCPLKGHTYLEKPAAFSCFKLVLQITVSVLCWPMLYSIKGTQMQISKVSLYVCVHIKTIPLKFCFLNPRNSRYICPWSLYFLKK